MAPQEINDMSDKTETIALGGGCFWCLELLKL